MEKEEEITKALTDLMAEISWRKGHGNPIFPCRTESYLALMQAEATLKKYNVPYKMRP